MDTPNVARSRAPERLFDDLRKIRADLDRVIGEPGGPRNGPSEYWTAQDVSKMLRLSEKSIYRLVRDDPSFPCVRLGRGALRFPKGRVLRWLADRTQGQARPRRSVAR